jgi:flagellar basal body-associated protein FliL
MADKSPTPEGAQPEASAGGGGGGIKPFIPLIANLILMPVLAVVTVNFALKSKLETAGGGGEAKQEAKQEAKKEGGSEKSAKEEKKGEKHASGGAVKYAAPLSKKIIVNVARSQGTRFLLADVTIVSSKPDIKEIVDEHDAELRNAAIGVMYTKTISDLEQPQAMNLIRSELLSVFSNILGAEVIKEIYLTEFAIQ